MLVPPLDGEGGSGRIVGRAGWGDVRLGLAPTPTPPVALSDLPARGRYGRVSPGA